MHTCFDSVQIDYLWEKERNEISACVINTTSLYTEILTLCVTNNLNLNWWCMLVYSLRKVSSKLKRYVVFFKCSSFLLLRNFNKKA